MKKLNSISILENLFATVLYRTFIHIWW